MGELDGEPLRRRHGIRMDVVLQQKRAEGGLGTGIQRRQCSNPVLSVRGSAEHGLVTLPR